MYYNHIHYDLGCRSCKNIRPNGMTMLQSKEPIERLTREELIGEMDNFKEIQCEGCGTVGNWLVFRIRLNEDDEVRDQFKVNIFKEDGRIFGKPEDGFFSPAQIQIAFQKIREEIRALEGQEYVDRPNGTAFIMVDFIKDEPYSRVSIFDLDGISLHEVEQFINALSAHL